MARLYILFFLSIILIIITTIFVQDHEKFRYYKNNLACESELIFGKKNINADIVFLGGSVMSDLMTKNQESLFSNLKLDSKDLKYVNLSSSNYSLLKEYIILRDYLNFNKTKIAVIQFMIQDFKKIHNNFENIGKLSDINLANSSGKQFLYMKINDIIKKRINHPMIFKKIDTQDKRLNFFDCGYLSRYDDFYLNPEATLKYKDYLKSKYDKYTNYNPSKLENEIFNQFNYLESKYNIKIYFVHFPRPWQKNIYAQDFIKLNHRYNTKFFYFDLYEREYIYRNLEKLTIDGYHFSDIGNKFVQNKIIKSLNKECSNCLKKRE